MDDDTIDYIELRHVTHVRASKNNHDLHVVRDLVHHKDGTTESRTRLLKDFKRPFYVVPPHHRSYKQKKEREPMSRLTKHMTTQSQMATNMAKAIGMPYLHGSIKMIANSPFIYGADIRSETYLRLLYRNKYPQPPSPLRYLAYDLETCVFDDDGHILIASLAGDDDSVMVYINKAFVGDMPNVVSRIHTLQEKLFREGGYDKYMEGCTVTYEVVDDEVALIKAIAVHMLQYNPDVVAAWNHDFDVNRLIDRCKVLGLSMADLFSDPSIPSGARRFEFKEGARSKKTVSDGFRPLQPSEQWHNIYATSSYMWVDAMCIYRRLRSQEAFLASYGIDAVSQRHLDVGKLHLAETDGMSGLERHQHMQKHRKLEYCVYAALDPRLMILLERQTNDITLRLSTDLAGSDIQDAASPSKRTTDMFYFDLLSKGYVLGSTGSDAEEWEAEILPLSGWPLTLPNNLINAPGIRCLEDRPDHTTNIHTVGFTRDITSGYPNGIRCLNTSKETTYLEVCDIKGTNCDRPTWILQNINLINGPVNAIDYMHFMYKWPTLTQLDAMVDELLAAQASI